MNYEVKSIEMKNEFKNCLEIGYKDGDTTKWLFICPNCHSVFDVSFTV